MAEDFNAYMPGRSLSTISMISRVSGRVLGGPKKPTWKAWKNEAPGHQNRARRAGFESELRTTWKTWKAWKNEAPGLLDTKTGLEGQGSKVKSEQHGKPGKRGKMKLLDIKIGLVIRACKSTTWKGWKRTFRSLWGGCSSSPLCISYEASFET